MTNHSKSITFGMSNVSPTLNYPLLGSVIHLISRKCFLKALRYLDAIPTGNLDAKAKLQKTKIVIVIVTVIHNDIHRYLE